MKLSNLTTRDVDQAAAKVRRELRTAHDAACRGDRNAAFSHAQDAWQNAFDFMQLFALESEEIDQCKHANITELFEDGLPVSEPPGGNDPEAQ